MTGDERRERGVRLCRQLSEAVSTLVPRGIGRWDRAWDMVAVADAVFIEALKRWEATGDDEDKPALRHAYYAVLDAWVQAAAAYEEAARNRRSWPQGARTTSIQRSSGAGARDPMELENPLRPHEA